MIFCGIDPGSSGYIAIINDNGNIDFHPIPIIEKKIDSHKLLNILNQYKLDGILIEEQLSLPGRNAGLVTRFTNYGMILSAVNLSNHPFEIIKPKKWKKILGLSSNKDESIQMAAKLFKNVDLYGQTPTGKKSTKISHDKAEALLLAHLCKQTIQKN